MPSLLCRAHNARSLLATLLFSSCVASALAQAPVSPLEQSLLDKRYSDFQPEAARAAAGGDAEALFLLGKSYAQGLGVEKDQELARSYYRKAEARGSVRATHNLGVLALDAGDRKAAIEQFQKALDKGLKMPTLYNLGRAYEPADPDKSEEVAERVIQARKSGDYYAKAFEVAGKASDVDAASRQYLRAYAWQTGIPTDSDSDSDSDSDEKGDPLITHELVLTWLNKAKEQDTPAAWSNYGALMYIDGNYDEARPAFEKAAKRDIPAAHRYLGKMDERESGMEQERAASALAHYERALELGLTAARGDVYRMLMEQMNSEWNADVLERGTKRLQELYQDGVNDRGRLDRLLNHYKWRRFVAQQAKRTRPVPKLPIYLNACQLDPRTADGERYKLPNGAQWSLELHDAEFWHDMQADVDIDASGCAKLSEPFSPKLRSALERGEVVSLTFKSHKIPLDWRVEKTRIVLVPYPGNLQFD
ncbi:SEL1-like repeat protein [Pseudoduganella violaceinigra]|uniref:SEL1-like repeat protein n=1 Tax=Pseudoduganella violaceinigra TaxID=246602 RepID=UPI00041CC07E|nr:sel1 repeat family protein [Pseudoduganella violaceinigra]